MKRAIIANSVLWAAATIASAMMHAPTFLTLILIPMLGFTSIIVMEAMGRRLQPSKICR